MKVKITLSYDGSRFRGSQIQKEHKDTVSQKLYFAFRALNINSKFNFSGRTDAKVHALNQVLDIKIPNYWGDLKKLKNALNRICLPHIYIKEIKEVNLNFHARFSAKKRVYRYIVSTSKINIFLTPYVTFIDTIDENRVKSAIKLFEGKHNFAYFKKNGTQTKTDICTIYKTRFYQFKEFYIFYFEADRFLRSQIRIMVDFLLKIGRYKLTQKELTEQLLLKKKHSCTLALPNGLYLAKVKY